MPDIEFKDLNRSSIGTELFTDTESFLEDLTDDAANILGGISEGAGVITSTIAGGTTIVTTSVIRPEDSMTTTVYHPYPGDGIYTVVKSVYNPPKPRHRRPIHPTFFATGDDI
jgi:hypothetical protein